MERRESILDVTESLRRAGSVDAPADLKVSAEDRPLEMEYEWADIPVIDLSLMESDRAGLSRAFGDAATQWGICRLINHAIPADAMREVEARGMDFFGLPAREKLSLASSERSSYTGDNSKLSTASLHWAESWVLDLPRLTSDPLPDLDKFLQQIFRDFPPGSDQFKTALLKYIIGLTTTTRQLLQLVAQYLELKSNTFTDSDTSITLRWNYYPACPVPNEVLGAFSHTDPNFVTILHQDKVGGLQVEKNGQWLAVKPMEGAVTVNVSDMLHMWTNGVFKNVLHRVLVNPDVHRLSLAAIVCLEEKISLSTPEELVDEKRPRLYRDITAGEYTKQVVRARQSAYPKFLDGRHLLEALKIRG